MMAAALLRRNWRFGTTRLTAYICAAELMLAVVFPIFHASPANAANFSMRVGYYLGTGATKTISGLGFQPQLVIIRASTTAGVSVFKTSAMPAANVAYFNGTVDNTANNITLNADGFSVATLANVNTANVLYRWYAFTGSDCSSTGYFCMGTYTGNGAASRAITTGFQPDMVTVKRSTNVGAHFRTAAMAANRTEFFTTTAADTAGNYIASFAATSFTVGATDNVNGGVYNFFAFRGGAGSFAQGTYSGNATDNQDITGVGFQPDLVVVKNSTSATANNRRSIMSGDKHFGDLSSYLSDVVVDGVNMVQAMQSDGFQVGAGVNVNQTGTTMYWFAFGGAPSPAGTGTFSMAQGSYTGNGAARSISAIGFAPDLVIVKDNAANFAVFRIKQMAGDTTAYFASATADFAGGITSLGSDDFSLGTSTVTNTNGNTYHWQAFGNAYTSDTSSGSADFATGVYHGNGIGSRGIADIPFQPDLVAMKRNSTTAATFRTSAHSGDISSFFAATADAANTVQSLLANGFQAGTNAAVNSSGSLYRWFAFKSGTNFSVGSYTGNGVNGRQVAAPFWSDAIWVKRSTAVAGVLRPSTLAGTATQLFPNTANTATAITAINASGFTVGTNTATNTNGGLYRYAVWRVPPTGGLSVDIVDSGGATVGSPSVGFGSLGLVFNCAESNATLGATEQRIRVTNMSANASWVLSIAPTGGVNALWDNVGNTAQYDFNDITGSPAGCSDGSDSDSVAGKLRVEPALSTITPQLGCSVSNVTRGSDEDYDDGTVDAINLMTAASGSNTECYWELTGVTLRQNIPAEQLPGTYSVGLTITIIAQ
ncbi:hypothetical protein IPL85_03125 [Candidatus Saccharibacteria bacterium]|nr:MAG: hypothetical protein IPL85_03125 [Candidatus Saccharibacteria bacterium]